MALLHKWGLTPIILVFLAKYALFMTNNHWPMGQLLTIANWKKDLTPQDIVAFKNSNLIYSQLAIELAKMKFYNNRGILLKYPTDGLGPGILEQIPKGKTGFRAYKTIAHTHINLNLVDDVDYYLQGKVNTLVKVVNTNLILDQHTSLLIDLIDSESN